MGKTILTAKQLDFLELVQAQPGLTKRFYLTGGTALAEFYFQHRLSEDIDLFSEREVYAPQVRHFLQGIAPKLGIAKIHQENFLGLFSYKLTYKDGETLKVDFNYYPFPKIEIGVKFKNLEVSSIYDIGVNKVHTVSMKPRVRDYVDLFFIFRDSSENPAELLRRMRLDSQNKFDWPLEPKNLAVGLARIKDFKKTDLPKMLKPFNFTKAQEFFLKLAKSLEGEIFK